MHRVAPGRASLSSAHTFASHVVCIAGRAILRATKNSATRLSRSVRRRTTLVPYNENFIGIASRALLSRRSGFCRMAVPMRHSRLSGSPKSPGIAWPRLGMFAIYFDEERMCIEKIFFSFLFLNWCVIIYYYYFVVEEKYQIYFVVIFDEDLCNFSAIIKYLRSIYVILSINIFLSSRYYVEYKYLRQCYEKKKTYYQRKVFIQISR